MNQLKLWLKAKASPRSRERLRILAECWRRLRATQRNKEAGRAVPIPDLRLALEQAGIGRGDVLLVHSSMDALMKSGPANGPIVVSAVEYAKAVLEMLFDLLGPEGTLMMPTAPIRSGYDMAMRGDVFDFRRARTGTGMLPQLLCRRQDAIRGQYPWQNATVCGNRAADLMKDHERATPYAMSVESPWYRLGEAGGKVALIGVTHARSSTLHVVDYCHPQEFPQPVFFDKPHRFCYKDKAGDIKEVPMFLHAVTWMDDDLERYCEYVQQKHGIYQIQALHHTTITCFNADDQYRAFLAEMKAGVTMYDCQFWRR